MEQCRARREYFKQILFVEDRSRWHADLFSPLQEAVHHHGENIAQILEENKATGERILGLQQKHPELVKSKEYDATMASYSLLASLSINAEWLSRPMKQTGPKQPVRRRRYGQANNTFCFLAATNGGNLVDRRYGSRNRKIVDRNQTTQDRARNAAIELVQSDVDLVNESDYIISIVPPRDALATAQRIINASISEKCKHRERSLFFLDLNAISPRSAREIHDCFARDAPAILHVDGGIIGGPPHVQAEGGGWYIPKIPVSGPHKVMDERLAQVLNLNHLTPTIGSATGLKMCFAALSKGFTALAIQSFTTAHNLDVLPDLKEHLELLNPATLKTAERGLIGMPPKAYRWVKEMDEIAETFEADGGFSAEESPFRGIARVYDLVAYETDLGKEKTDSRVRGKTSEDVANLVARGTRMRKDKME
nr:hypothetical protein CFP56_58822 [Quercus suber]